MVRNIFPWISKSSITTPYGSDSRQFFTEVLMHKAEEIMKEWIKKRNIAANWNQHADTCGANRKIFPLFFFATDQIYRDLVQHFFNIFQYLCFVGKIFFRKKSRLFLSQHYTMDGIDVDLDGKNFYLIFFGGRSCLYGSAWKKWIGVILFWRVSFLEKSS